jgi:general secretion pathway protein K
VDSLIHLNGAEDNAYLAAGKPYGAKDGPFDSVEELQLVLGMTPELYRRLKPALTVYSRQPGINPAVASPEVLLAIPGMGVNTVEQYMALREQNRKDGLPPPQPPLVDRHYIARTTGRTYSIHAQARLQSGVTAHITTIVDLRGRDPAAPFTVLSWRQEGDELFPEQEDES